MNFEKEVFQFYFDNSWDSILVECLEKIEAESFNFQVEELVVDIVLERFAGVNISGSQKRKLSLSEADLISKKRQKV